MLKTFGLVAALLLPLAMAASAADAPGVTKTEIQIGTTVPFSGPVSGAGNIGLGLIVHVQSINDRGVSDGRKLNLISLE